MGIDIIQQWIIMGIIILGFWILTRNLKIVPNTKKQNILEMIVVGFNNWVRNTMGDGYISFVPFIFGLAIFLLGMNLTEVFGFKPATSSFSVTVSLSLLTFLIVQINSIKKNGVFGYLKGYLHPASLLLPVNILERVMLPVTLSFRLFGNITVSVVLMELIYRALNNISWIFQMIIPVPFIFYFDLFDGVLQTFIFTILTMINIKMVAEE